MSNGTLVALEFIAVIGGLYWLATSQKRTRKDPADRPDQDSAASEASGEAEAAKPNPEAR